KRPCSLCAAHLSTNHDASDGVVALLGRFLPRLGPFGSPSGPFSFVPARQASLTGHSSIGAAAALQQDGWGIGPAGQPAQPYSAAARRSIRRGSTSNTRAATSSS